MSCSTVPAPSRVAGRSRRFGRSLSKQLAAGSEQPQPKGLAISNIEYRMLNVECRTNCLPSFIIRYS